MALSAVPGGIRSREFLSNMAKDGSGGDGMDEASLDDFFQPPTQDEGGDVVDAELFAPPAPLPAAKKNAPAGAKKTPVLQDHEAVQPFGTAEEAPIEMTPDDDVTDLFGDTSGPGEPAQAVEDLDFSDGAPDKAKKRKKMILIGGAVFGLLLLIGAGFMLFGGSATPPPPPPRPVAAEPPPPVEAPPPAPKIVDPFPGPFAMLGDIDRRPDGANVLTRTLFNASGDADEAARSALPRLAKNQFLSFYFGTYVVPAHLDGAKERVRQWGIKPIQRTADARIDMLRLRVAEFPQRATSEKLARELKGKGFDAFVIKNSPSSYTVYAGSFFTQAKYAEYAAKLGPAGYPPGTQERVQLTKRVYELWGGQYKTVPEAETAMTSMLKAGWNPRLYLAD